MPPDTDSARRADTTDSPDAIRLGVDVGGTFTDAALLVDGELVTAKVPTTADGSVGVLDAVRKVCASAGVDPADVDGFTHATTVSVNALLERAGARTALVTTEGFRDVLEIGRQDRPALYDLDAEKPEPLVPRRRRFEVPERATTAGIETPVDPDDARAVAEAIEETDAESVAVCLLHAYAHPENEERVTDVLREELDVPIVASHETLPEFREYERTATTVADAYLTPGVDGYLGRLVDRAADAGLPVPRVMASNGGVMEADAIRDNAVATVLSGPAAGVVGAAAAAGPNAETGVVTFDMGGTSSDVSLARGGEAARTAETEIDGIPIRTPTVDVETVGAGGGSIAWVDSGGALRVGPESAGADPGPACYGQGGARPTVTDAAVVLGYVGEDAALGGEIGLDADAAWEVLTDLADDAGLADATDAALGVHRVAVARMARAIRSVTVERGHDPREFGLVAFGGAGPMHAAALADDLDIGRVLVPGPAGVCSAYGLLAADESHDVARTQRFTLDDVDDEAVEVHFSELEDRALANVSDRGAARVERAVDCRFVGQSFELTVPASDPFDPDALGKAFVDAHEEAYGYALDASVEAVTLRVTATVERATPPPGGAARGESGARDDAGETRIGSRQATFPESGRVDTGVHGGARLVAGATLTGPAVIERTEDTTVVPPGWTARMRESGTLELVVEDGAKGADDEDRGVQQ